VAEMRAEFKREGLYWWGRSNVCFVGIPDRQLFHQKAS
jgi:hypothetical protein